MRHILIAALCVCLCSSLAAAASVPADQLLYTGIASVGETGQCNSDGTGTVAGRGLYATGFMPPDRDEHSTFVLDAFGFSARGTARMNLCLRLTSSPLPTVTLYVPSPDLGDVNPDEWLFGRRNGSCVDSKAYGGQGTLQFQEFDPRPPFKGSHVVRLADVSWKAAAAKHVVALGRWSLESDPDVGGQLIGLFAFQGGAACFFPEGAMAFTSAGTLSLLQSGAHARWDDIVQPVDAKDGSGPLRLWGDKVQP